MSASRAGAVAVDTMVFSWLAADYDDPVPLSYRELAAERPLVIAFQTAFELRYGALRAGWGELRIRRLERRIAAVNVSRPDDATITLCAQLREDCRKAGHPLAAKIHDGDRWIAATAIRLGIPLVSDDGIFRSTPRLELLTAN